MSRKTSGLLAKVSFSDKIMAGGALGRLIWEADPSIGCSSNENQWCLLVVEGFSFHGDKWVLKNQSIFKWFPLACAFFFSFFWLENIWIVCFLKTIGLILIIFPQILGFEELQGMIVVRMYTVYLEVWAWVEGEIMLIEIVSSLQKLKPVWGGWIIYTFSNTAACFLVFHLWAGNDGNDQILPTDCLQGCSRTSCRMLV